MKAQIKKELSELAFFLRDMLTVLGFLTLCYFIYGFIVFNK